MKTLHDATLKLDHLLVHFSMKEKYASVLPNLAKKSLLSLGKLGNNGSDYILLDKIC